MATSGVQSTSRYSTPAYGSSVIPQGSSTVTNGTSTQDSNTNTNQTTNTSGYNNRTTHTTNMSPEAEAALMLMIKQLMGGGTQQMAQDRAQRQQEIQAVQQQRQGYSKSQAFADAQGAMAKQMSDAMMSTMPQLVRASEGAGTSQNSLRALLVADQQRRAAESASALGLKAAGDYGNIANGMSSILQQLTQPDNTVSNALLQALNIAKGVHVNTTDNSTSGSTSTTIGNSNTNTTGSTSQTSDTNGGFQGSGSTNGGYSSGMTTGNNGYGNDTMSMYGAGSNFSMDPNGGANSTGVAPAPSTAEMLMGLINNPGRFSGTLF